jgi:hypothetical protein
MIFEPLDLHFRVNKMVNSPKAQQITARENITNHRHRVTDVDVTIVVYVANL